MGLLDNVLRGTQRGMHYLAGRGMQFDDDMKLRRRNAMVKDTMLINDFLQAGHIEPAMRLAENRVKEIERLGGDPRHTQSLLEDLQAGRIDKAKSEVATVADWMKSQGLGGGGRKAQATSVGPLGATIATQSGEVNYIPLSEEDRKRRIEDELKMNQIALDKVTQEAMARSNVKTTEARDLMEISVEEARTQGLNDLEIEEVGKAINRGRIGAEMIPVVEYSIDLLRRAKTGGISSVADEVKNVFGAGARDFAQLNDMMSNLFFAALENFNGPISEGEMNTIKEFIANVKKGTEANLGILENNLLKFNNWRTRGLKAVELSPALNEESWTYQQMLPQNNVDYLGTATRLMGPSREARDPGVTDVRIQ